MAYEFLKLAKRRKTTYEFEDRKISRNMLLKILEAGRLAPSCGNAQPWHFIVIRNKKKIRECLSTCYTGHLFTEPPVLVAIVMVIPKEEILRQLACAKGGIPNIGEIQKCIGCSAMSMVYAAESLGINSALMSPDPKITKQRLNIPDPFRCEIIVGFGYEKKNAQKRKRRKPRNRFVNYGNE